jgi:hypothetical protein
LVSGDLPFYRYWREKFERDFSVEIKFFREHVKSLRGYVIRDSPASPTGLAEEFLGKIKNLPKVPELCGPHICIQDSYSEMFRSALQQLPLGGWSAVRATLSQEETATGPDGRPGVLKLVERAEGSTHDIRLRNGPSLPGRKRVVFAFVKSAGRSNCSLWLHTNFSTRAHASFSMENYTAHALGVTGHGWTKPEAGLVRLQDGWSWIWLSAETEDPLSWSASLLLSDDASGRAYYAGDGMSGIWLFDARVGVEIADWGW